MAEQHRRVESRSIIGTGMATDPERLRDIEQRAGRMERDYNLPKKRFGEVIATAEAKPPAGTELVDEAPKKDLRGHRPHPNAPPPRAKAPPRGAPPPVDSFTPPASKAAPKEPPDAPPAPPPKDVPKPPTGANSPEQSRSMGGHTQVTFKV